MVYGWGFLPAGALVTRITGAPKGLLVEGVAPGPLEAIAYASKLVEPGGFPSARLVSFAPGASGGGEFAIEVTR
jgi:hypothetical protein